MKTYDWNLPKQTLFRDPNNRKVAGDCWRCCVAAVIQIPAQEVPHFLQIELDEEGAGCDALTQKWLNERGLILIHCTAIYRQGFVFYHSGSFDYPPVIACGPTPRSRGLGQHHAVIRVADKVVYDPHPDDTGLTSIMDEYMIVPSPSMGCAIDNYRNSCSPKP